MESICHNFSPSNMYSLIKKMKKYLKTLKINQIFVEFREMKYLHK